MNSIFVRSSRLTTVAVLAAYAVVAGAIYFGIQRYLEQQVDEELNTKASVLATLVHRDRRQSRRADEDRVHRGVDGSPATRMV